jgi:hypothetical protein
MLVANKYLHIGFFDTSSIADNLAELGEAIWDEDSTRQQIFDVHKHTKTIIVQNFPLDWDGNLFPTELSKSKAFLLYPLLKPLIENLENVLDGKAGRVLLTKLNPNSSISPHVDNGYYLSVVHRVHVPVKTNEKVVFTVDGVSRHIAKNECVEISNSQQHSVVNNSDEERIHIICDIVPNYLIKSES